MMCFRDMTFCESDCTNTTCFRHYGPDDAASAKRWWGGDDAPVAFADMRVGCPDYRPEVSGAQ